MYIAVNIALLLGALVKDKKAFSKNIYWILFIVLWLMLSLRYGQGTDYFGYYFIHSRNLSLFDAIHNTHQTHSEIGFRLLCWLFRENYTYLIVFVSTVEMMLLHRFIKNYSSNASMSLLLVYPTIYLTYFFSAIREGIVISIFIGIMIECVERKKFKTYFMLSALCCTIHTVSILLFFVPLIIKISTKKMVRFAVFSFIIGIIFWIFNFYTIIQYVPFVGKMVSSYSPQISYMALLERIIMYILVLWLYYGDRNKEQTKSIDILFNIYTFGIIGYFILLSFPLVSSRVAILFKAVEIVLVPALYSKSSIKIRDKQIIVFIIVLISLVMTIKNINSYISQGHYNSDITVFNYPYVSIFEKDDIWMYRESNIYYELVD